MLESNILNQIDQKINYAEFYNSKLNKFKIYTEQATALCPFHDDEVSSLSINLKTGQYHCHACQRSGNVITFVKEILHLATNHEAIEWLCIYLGIEFEQVKYIDESKVIELHEKLISSQAVLEYLQTERGLSLETIIKYRLGLHKDRIAIPILDQKNRVLNIRLYKPHCNKSDAKMISWERGYGKAQLFPAVNLANDPIILVEGEMDCLVANQLGFNAVTVTSGAGSWRNEFNEYFKSKTVYICYDIDQPGIEGAKRVADILIEVTKNVYIVKLPITEPPNGDITDYFVKQGYSINDFQELLAASVRYIREAKTIRPSEYTQVSLADASRAEYYNRNVELNVQITGKDLSPYIVPCKVKFFCAGSLSDRCKACKMARSGYMVTIEYDHDDEELLKLIDTTDTDQLTILKKRAALPVQCGLVQMEVLESINIEEVHVIPVIEYSTDENPYVIRVAYFVGHGIKTNCNYTLRGVTLPHPRTQHATHLIKHAEPAASSIDLFQMTPDLYEQLKIFQVDDYAPIECDLEKVTGIYSRSDLHFAYDLVFHSVLQFKFNGKMLRKGWCECLVLGDTGTGKSQSIEAMINHYRAGEFGLGENSSFAGLVGGLQQTAKRWSLNWGKIPLNDRKLYVIDEASGLSYEDIALMSGIRSTGIAEITKIQTEKTYARTRIIWISNPRHAATLSQFGYGVLAVKDLIGKPEDIRRFDFVITCASGDVDSAVFNRQQCSSNDLVYTSDLCNALVMWAWSRKPNQILFTESATKLILQYADIMGKKYNPGIPIVEAADQRIKLARMAAACAARFFSTQDGEILIINDQHVIMVYDFLEQCYNNKSLRYDYWSENENKRRTLKNEAELYHVITPDLAEFLLDSETLRISDFRAVIDDSAAASAMIRRLISQRAMVRANSGYFRKTEAFVNLLRKILAKNPKEDDAEKIPF